MGGMARLVLCRLLCALIGGQATTGFASFALHSEALIASKVLDELNDSCVLPLQKNVAAPLVAHPRLEQHISLIPLPSAVDGKRLGQLLNGPHSALFLKYYKRAVGDQLALVATLLSHISLRIVGLNSTFGGNSSIAIELKARYHGALSKSQMAFLHKHVLPAKLHITLFSLSHRKRGAGLDGPTALAYVQTHRRLASCLKAYGFVGQELATGTTKLTYKASPRPIILAKGQPQPQILGANEKSLKPFPEQAGDEELLLSFAAELASAHPSPKAAASKQHLVALPKQGALPGDEGEKEKEEGGDELAEKEPAGLQG